MQKKFNIRKGDTVLVLSGEYKGQQGKILKMITKTDRALVEGINLVSKHTKPNAKNPQGGVIKKEAPIHVSNLMLVSRRSATAYSRLPFRHIALMFSAKQTS